MMTVISARKNARDSCESRAGGPFKPSVGLSGAVLLRDEGWWPSLPLGGSLDPPWDDREVSLKDPSPVCTAQGTDLALT